MRLPFFPPRASGIRSFSPFSLGWVLALLIFFVAFEGCSSERTWGGYDRRTHLWMTTKGWMAEDRVSGALIDPATAIVLEYQGDPYFFESWFNANMFIRDPGVYDYHGYHPNYGGGP